ncbi:uncharacterized protein LOC123892111 [Trifolium pratense]|uniref:uncharacterized protein LOC123892111 n=1 Tax=Trifolium pratense TaxID=57577 RepID=UPI001E69291E|nr:uncharacterized protein LOC123892111 [Trifolium pratense]
MVIGYWISQAGITTNINAELQTILNGLQMAWNNGFLYVECKSDCQSALNFIHDGVPTTHLYAPVIDLIRRFIDYIWLLSFHHSLREDNIYTDWLAKHGVRLEGDMISWRQYSTPLSTYLLADSMGISSPEINLVVSCCFFLLH